MKYILSILLFNVVIFQPDPKTDKIRKEMSRIFLYMGNPPEAFTTDTCFQHSAFVKLDIDKYSKVTSIEYNDSAAAWMKKGLLWQKKQNGFRYHILDSLVKAEKLKNCTLVFPVIVQSIIYPNCGSEKLRPVPVNQFRFNGKLLGGVVWFGEDLVFEYNTRYRTKAGDQQPAFAESK